MMRDVQIALYDMITSTTPESNKSHIKRTIRLKARIVFTLNVVIMLW
jgi:hypothetical protein